MPFRKRAARSGLEVSLELRRAFLIREFHGSNESPRTSRRRVRRDTFIVGSNSIADVRRQTRVVASGDAFTLQNVDEALLGGHDRLSQQDRFQPQSPDYSEFVEVENLARSIMTTGVAGLARLASRSSRWFGRSTFAWLGNSGPSFGGQPPRDHGRAEVGGPDRDRTGDLMNAIHARSQLRYWPTLGKKRQF